MTDDKTRENIWKYTLIILIIGLGILIFNQAEQFLSGALGAMTLFILLRNPTYRLAEKIKPTLATSLVIAGVVLFIIIPLSLIVWFIISKLQQVNWSTDAFIAPALDALNILKEKFGIEHLISDKTISFAAAKITALGQSIINGIGDVFINIFVAILLLFFLLQGGRKMEKYIVSMLPFKNINKQKLIKKINIMVRANAIGIPLLALIQGLIAWGGYMAFGAPNAFLNGFLTGLCSVVPIVGTMIVWVPVASYFFIIGMWGKGIGLLIFGALVISQCDNLIRFILQKKMANTHPLITIFGVVIGLPLFGFIGIIFGPLLVSLFLLFLEMFRKEYLVGPEDEADSQMTNVGDDSAVGDDTPAPDNDSTETID